jgi:cytosine/adenosine deaminase-related metal-dependent hydrolase
MIVNNANLVTHWPTEPTVEGALVAIEGKSIVDFGKVGKLVDRYDDTEVLDVSGRLVVPGMIDAHARVDRRLQPGRAEEALDPETLYWSCLVSLLDAVRAGTTTVFAWVPVASDESVESVSRAFEEVRVRGSVALAISSRSRDGEAIERNVRRIRSCAGSAAEWRHGFFGLDASSPLEPSTIAAAVEAADALGAGFHVVLGEEGGAAGLLRSGVWRKGGIVFPRGELTPDDARALGGADVFVARSPRSSAVRGARPIEPSGEGDRAALGTDGIGLGLLDELRMAALGPLPREGRESRSSRLRGAYRSAFVVNPDLATASFGPELGRIKPGARADLVVLDYRPSTPLEEKTVPEHLAAEVAGAPIETVIVKGRILYHNRQFVGLDEERIRARARESAKKLWERL